MHSFKLPKRIKKKKIKKKIVSSIQLLFTMDSEKKRYKNSATSLNDEFDLVTSPDSSLDFRSG